MILQITYHYPFITRLPHSLIPPDLGAWLWNLFAVGSATFAHVPGLVAGSHALPGLFGSFRLGCKT